ncbi:MAG: hypothetical protein SWH68_15860 [Thermodesulfobacteriota bacterium]|nr:hypothetical protein [Thermodesulfobacteriota bacterium]
MMVPGMFYPIGAFMVPGFKVTFLLKLDNIFAGNIQPQKNQDQKNSQGGFGVPVKESLFGHVHTSGSLFTRHSTTRFYLFFIRVSPACQGLKLLTASQKAFYEAIVIDIRIAGSIFSDTYKQHRLQYNILKLIKFVFMGETEWPTPISPSQ